MTLLEGAVDEWATSPTTEVTAVDGEHTPSARRQRAPEDGEVERITLRLRGPSGVGEAQLLGGTSWALAGVMLAAWAACLRRGEDDGVDFAVRFRDGQTVGGRTNIRRKAGRDLASVLRRVQTFRASLCPDLSDDEAGPMFRFFLANYAVPARASASL